MFVLVLGLHASMMKPALASSDVMDPSDVSEVPVPTAGPDSCVSRNFIEGYKETMYKGQLDKEGDGISMMLGSFDGWLEEMKQKKRMEAAKKKQAESEAAKEVEAENAVPQRSEADMQKEKETEERKLATPAVSTGGEGSNGMKVRAADSEGDGSESSVVMLVSIVANVVQAITIVVLSVVVCVRTQPQGQTRAEPAKAAEVELGAASPSALNKDTPAAV